MSQYQIARYLFQGNLFLLFLVLIVPLTFFVIIHVMETKPFNVESLGFLGLAYLLAAIPTLLGSGLLWGYYKIAQQQPFSVSYKTFWIVSGVINLLWGLLILAVSLQTVMFDLRSLLNPWLLITIWSFVVAAASFYASQQE